MRRCDHSQRCAGFTTGETAYYLLITHGLVIDGTVVLGRITEVAAKDATIVAIGDADPSRTCAAGLCPLQPEWAGTLGVKGFSHEGPPG